MSFVSITHFSLPFLLRIQKDLVDPEKLQATLTDEVLGDTVDLNRALEMVALLEAQLKEMNPNLDSISEYYSVNFMKLERGNVFPQLLC